MTPDQLIERALDDLLKTERPTSAVQHGCCICTGFPVSPQLLAEADAENRFKRKAILSALVVDVYHILANNSIA